MRKTIIIGIIAMIALLAVLLTAGCDPKPSANVSVSPGVEINPVTGEPYQDIVEKRGVKTNITEFNELLVRATRLQSFKYNLTDTDIDDEPYRIYTLGRWVKIQLPDIKQHSSGEIYDEVLMDRQTKTALSHCSLNTCPKPNTDKELEKVEYDDYYIKDIMEYLYKVTDAQFIKEEMVGNDYTKVFSARFEGDEARVWLQEYYGYPLVIMVKKADGSKRTIKFTDVTVDATRSGETDTPGNFTVKGEQGSWLFYKHYLGEWPEEGVKLPVQQPQPTFGA